MPVTSETGTLEVQGLVQVQIQAQVPAGAPVRVRARVWPRVRSRVRSLVAVAVLDQELGLSTMVSLVMARSPEQALAAALKLELKQPS